MPMSMHVALNAKSGSIAQQKPILGVNHLVECISDSASIDKKDWHFPDDQSPGSDLFLETFFCPCHLLLPVSNPGW